MGRNVPNMLPMVETAKTFPDSSPIRPLSDKERILMINGLTMPRRKSGNENNMAVAISEETKIRAVPLEIKEFISAKETIGRIAQGIIMKIRPAIMINLNNIFNSGYLSANFPPK